MDDQVYSDLLRNETPATGDGEGETCLTSSESSTSSVDTHACSDLLRHQTPDTGDGEGESCLTSSESSTSSVDAHACSDLLGNETPDTGDGEGESCFTSSESSTSSVDAHAFSDLLSNENQDTGDYGQNQVTTHRVGFCDLQSEAKDNEEYRQNIDSNSKRDSCDAHKTKVPGFASSTECSHCNVSSFREGDDKHGHGNENVRKHEDPDVTHPKTHASTSVTDPDRTYVKTPVSPSVTDPDKTNVKTPALPSVADPDKTYVKTPASPSVTDPDRTYVKTPASPSVTDPDRTYVKTPVSDTEDSGIGDSSDEESVNNVQDPDETYPKESFAGDHADIYKRVESLSQPNSYSVLHYPKNTFLQLVLPSGLKDNAAKSQHMTSRHVTPANKVGSQSSDPDAEETIPKTALQQLSSYQQSDSEDIDYSREILSSELSQEDRSIITSGYSLTDKSSNKTCNDMHRDNILLQKLQRTCLSLSLTDTEYLSTDPKNLILFDSSVIRLNIRRLADFMSSAHDRNPGQESHERGIDATEGRPDAPLIEGSKHGFDTPLPSSCHTDENNINYNLQQGKREGNPKTHSSYLSQENELHVPLSSTRSDGKTLVDYEKHFTDMNHVSVKELGMTELISDKKKGVQSSVSNGELPDSQLDPHADFSTEREAVLKTQLEPDLQPSSQSLEQEAIYRPFKNILAPPCTHGRPDLSLSVQQQHSQAPDAGLGKDDTPEMTGSSQVGRQDLQTGQLQDNLGRATTVEMSECQQTTNDSPLHGSEQDFPQPQYLYQIPSKLQDYSSSEQSVYDSDPDDVLQAVLGSKVMSNNLDGLTNLTNEDSQQHGMSHYLQSDPAIDDAQTREQAVKQTIMPISDQSLHAGVPSHDYTAVVRMSDNPFHISPGGASGHTEASGAGTDDDASCRTRKVAPNTVKKILNEDMEGPQTKEKQQYLILNTPDKLRRKRDSEQPLLDQERQDIFHNSLTVASGKYRETIWNNQCEGSLRVPDEMNLRQGWEVFGREVEAEGQEEDDEDDDADKEENVQHNQEY